MNGVNQKNYRIKPSLISRVARNLLIKPYARKAFDVERNSVEKMRRSFINMSKMSKLPRSTVIKKMVIGNLPAEYVIAQNVENKEQVILYFHGGGFFSGSCDTHRDLANRISQSSGVQVLLIEYGLSPENKYPTPNIDCLAAYRWLLSNGYLPEDIIIGGDSAGASLALMTLLSLRDTGVSLPKGAFMLSPWDPFIFDGESYISKAKLDPFNNLKNFQLSAAYYYDGSINKTPITPLTKEDFTGSPNLLIQVGGDEVILSDCIRISDRAKQNGVSVKLEVYNGMWHVFQTMSFTPEAKKSLDSIGKFINTVLKE